MSLAVRAALTSERLEKFWYVPASERPVVLSSVRCQGTAQRYGWIVVGFADCDGVAEYLPDHPTACSRERCRLARLDLAQQRQHGRRRHLPDRERTNIRIDVGGHKTLETLAMGRAPIPNAQRDELP